MIADIDREQWRAKREEIAKRMRFPRPQFWLTPTAWPIVAILASAFILAAAHGFEAYGYPPCALCLRQREAYWGVIGFSAFVLAINRLHPSERLSRALTIIIGLAFLWGAILAGFHAGVEWKFWPGPKSCTGGASRLTPMDIGAALNGPQLVVMCDEAAWRLLGLSMAGYNALIAAGLGALSFASAARRRTIFLHRG